MHLLHANDEVGLSDINEVGCFSVAIWIAVAAGKCYAPRPLGVACERGEIAARACLTLEGI